MSTLATLPAGAPGAARRPWAQRWPLALAVLALFGWLLWSVSARQALLLLVAECLGCFSLSHGFLLLFQQFVIGFLFCLLSIFRGDLANL